MIHKNKFHIILIGLTLLLISIACKTLFPKQIAPGSVEEEIAKGNVRFEGKGNLTYGNCQDPTAMVSLSVSLPTQQFEDQEYYTPINPVSVEALTDGAIPADSPCEKFNTDEKHNWPARGIYYSDESKIVFYGCSLKDGRAEGQASLLGEGTDLYFEGEYACYSADGTLVYEMAFSVFRVAK
jgi:hypothetical protein